MLGTQIKQARVKANLSVAELAVQTQEPIDLLMAWENELQLPRQRDLVLIDQALHTDFSTSAYQDLKYSKQLGERTSIIKIILVAAGLLFFDFMMTGFGRQPVYIFMLVLFALTFVTLPAFFDDSWVLNEQNLTQLSYSENMFVKAVQVFDRRLRQNNVIPFSTIDDVELQYIVKTRESPFDTWPDYFNLIIQVGEKKTEIEVDSKLNRQLIPTMLHFSNQNVVVRDPQQILKLLANHENLYEHFHQALQKKA